MVYRYTIERKNYICLIKPIPLPTFLLFTYSCTGNKATKVPSMALNASIRQQPMPLQFLFLRMNFTCAVETTKVKPCWKDKNARIYGNGDDGVETLMVELSIDVMDSDRYPKDDFESTNDVMNNTVPKCGRECKYWESCRIKTYIYINHSLELAILMTTTYNKHGIWMIDVREKIYVYSYIFCFTTSDRWFTL